MNPGLAIFKRAQHLQEGDQTITDQQMIDRLGYDPGDPRNDLTRGSGSGVPTQRGFGYGANILGNFVFPGFGNITGPAASAITRWIQNYLGRQNVQNALNPSQPGQPTSGTPDDTGTTDASGDPYGLSQSPTGNPPPSTGVGIDPTGNPAKPGEWWSNDFGRWLTDQYGTSPGNYQGAGPGLGYGHLGTGFGSGTVGNFATAIGFDRLGAGQGSTNLSAMGGGPAASQMRQIMKGIYTPQTGYGYGPLGAFGGGGMGSAQSNIAGQQQLHDILMANPGALSGPISGNITRGVPMKQGVQKGSSDIGLKLFKKHQRLQGGTGDVKYTPVTPTKEYPYSSDYEFIHRKEPQGRDADLAHLTPGEQAQEQRDWEENIKSILSITPDLTPEERNQVLQLNPKDWDDSTREKVGAASEQSGKDMQLQKGTGNVMQTTGNNPGLRLFMQMQKLRRPTPMGKPQGYAKGSSGVLSTKERKAMPKSSFAIPSKAPASGSYPINDPSHARNALSRVSQFGSPAQKSQVRAAVHRKYPGIGKK